MRNESPAGNGRDTAASSHELPCLDFRGLKFAYSWKCNARCGHCAVFSSPERIESLADGAVLDGIDTAGRMGMDSVELTGGEIFLFYDKLLRFARRAHEAGLEFHLDTNGFWAKSLDVALRRLEPLVALGLQKIHLSTDLYHQAFIPLERVRHALEAAQEIGISATVTICSLANDTSCLETVAALHRLCPNIKIQPIAPFGRGAETLPQAGMRRISFAAAGRPCGQLASPNPTITPDGRVSLCCAPPMWLPVEEIGASPLILGWLDEEPLEVILQRAQSNELLRWLAARGIAGLVERQRAPEPASFVPREEGYFGACDLCLEVLGSQLGSQPLLNSATPPPMRGE